jgi:uncharacterized protein YegP (UPF0339 family)
MSARVEAYREREQVGPFAHDGSDWDNPTRPGKWRWRFISNGRIMADSGQGYSRRIDALTGCATVLGGTLMSNAAVDLPRDEWINRMVWLSPDEERAESVPIVDLTREATS